MQAVDWFTHSRPLHLKHTAARGRCWCCSVLLALPGWHPLHLVLRQSMPAFAGSLGLLIWCSAAALQCWTQPRRGGRPQRGSPMHSACSCRTSSASLAPPVWIPPGRRRGGHRLHVSFCRACLSSCVAVARLHVAVSHLRLLCPHGALHVACTYALSPGKSVGRVHTHPIGMHRLHCVAILLSIELANPPVAAGSHAAVGTDMLPQQCCPIIDSPDHPCIAELQVTPSFSSRMAAPTVPCPSLHMLKTPPLQAAGRPARSPPTCPFCIVPTFRSFLYCP